MSRHISLWIWELTRCKQYHWNNQVLSLASSDHKPQRWGGWSSCTAGLGRDSCSLAITPHVCDHCGCTVTSPYIQTQICTGLSWIIAVAFCWILVDLLKMSGSQITIQLKLSSRTSGSIFSACSSPGCCYDCPWFLPAGHAEISHSSWMPTVSHQRDLNGTFYQHLHILWALWVGICFPVLCK